MDPSESPNADKQQAVAAELVSTSTKSWKSWLVTGVVISVTFVIACGIAYLVGLNQGSKSTQTESSKEEATTWTCSMHPQVKLPKPGKCPICFMDLIPLKKDEGESSHPRELTMTPSAMALAEIQTTPVQRRFVTNSVRMVGKVDYDETKLAYITAWVPGRLDRLFIDYTGVTVRKGDHLVSMYSPDLVVAQRELIQAWSNYQRLGEERGDGLLLRTLKSTEEKIRLLGLTKEQIAEIKQRGTPSDHVTVYAPIGGVVIHKNANEGMYVQTGTRIYTIADLSQVWVFMDAYESDVPWLRYGQEVEFTTEAYPGEIFKGRVAFIDPVLNEKTRTVKVRVNVSNKDRRLKPGMFVRGIVKSRVAEGGLVIDDALAGKWVSPHHPEIVRDGPGKCPICGIDLVPSEELGFVKVDAGATPPLVIPASAPLLTGKRAVVYVKVPDKKQPTFQGREVMLGHRADGYYIVRHGLEEGEDVVTTGNFKIDSELQIAAKPSMMSPEGDAAGGGHHHHGGLKKAVGGDEHAGHQMADIEVPVAFRVALSPVYKAYLATSEALATDDLAKARQQVEDLLKAIKEMDPKSLDVDGRSRWKALSDKIAFASHETADAADKQVARRHFHDLSQAMQPLVQTFGHALEAPVYEFHCPMAFENKGATWLQAGSKTRNPYFGPAMLACGDTKTTFHSEAPLVVPASFRQRLTTVYDRYLKLQDDLATDRDKEAAGSAVALRDAVAKIDSAALNERSKHAWMLAHKQLGVALDGDLNQLDVSALRTRFEATSLAMLGVVENFGHVQNVSLYKAFCPMAFDNKGAPWLQASGEIANPYFGAKMLRCGSIQRTYPPKSDEEVQP